MKKFFLLAISFLMASMLFAAPFGLEMGMTLEEVKKKCGGKEPEYIGIGCDYIIEPINKNKAFTDYIVSIHDTLGLFGVSAATDYIDMKECRKISKKMVSMLELRYGKPSEVDELSLEYDWYVSECESLKKENLIALSLGILMDDDSESAMVMLMYAFENSEKAMETSNSPFGLEMGMTLEEIKKKCGGKEPEYKYDKFFYTIEPTKKNETFTEYIVAVHDTLGLFGVTAVTELIDVNECKGVCREVVSMLERCYGEPSEVDELSLECDWHVSECPTLENYNLDSINLSVSITDDSKLAMLMLIYKFDNIHKANEQ